ncbi:DUF998 domain-containing protein [Pseudonocardia sp. CA-107938]|uniref:DUF998 domain-containing protein n=1 Tax=Pseudonocardia sp. CA-107938 TaxID=3240021 RepID=UPI003D8AF69A
MTTRGARGAESAVVVGFVATAAVAGAALHVAGSGPVDPLRTVISDYVMVPGGYALLALAAVALAAASLALSVGLRRSGLPHPALPAALLVTGAIGLLVAGAVPTNLPGQPVGLGAMLHRVAGGATFVSLPLAGWLIARRAATASGEWRAHAAVLRWSAAVAGLVTIVFLGAQIPIVIGDSPLFPYVGGAERAACATVMVVLVTTARVMWTATAEAVGVRAARTATPVGVVGPVAVAPVAIELGQAA